MQKNQPNVELAHLLLADKDSEHYRNLLLFIVYKSIEANRNISVNQLYNLLRRSYRFTVSQVDSVIACLSNSDIIGGVTLYYRNDDINKAHLNLCQSDRFNQWLSRTLSSIPCLVEFSAPVYTKKHN